MDRRYDEMADAHARGDYVFERRADGRDHCMWCGSLTVADAVGALGAPGTHFSGADWRYGRPHKFYIGEAKFYAEHLTVASDAEFAAFADVAARLLGIRFAREASGEVRWMVDVSELEPHVRWADGFGGFQAFGDVRR